jgi:hypothetical protein
MRASWRSRSPGSGRRVRHLRRKNDLQPMTSSIFNFYYSFSVPFAFCLSICFHICLSPSIGCFIYLYPFSCLLHLSIYCLVCLFVYQIIYRCLPKHWYLKRIIKNSIKNSRKILKAISKLFLLFRSNFPPFKKTL